MTGKCAPGLYKKITSFQAEVEVVLEDFVPLIKRGFEPLALAQNPSRIVSPTLNITGWKEETEGLDSAIDLLYNDTATNFGRNFHACKRATLSIDNLLGMFKEFSTRKFIRRSVELSDFKSGIKRLASNLRTTFEVAPSAYSFGSVPTSYFVKREKGASSNQTCAKIFAIAHPEVISNVRDLQLFQVNPVPHEASCGLVFRINGPDYYVRSFKPDSSVFYGMTALQKSQCRPFRNGLLCPHNGIFSTQNSVEEEVDHESSARCIYNIQNYYGDEKELCMLEIVEEEGLSGLSGTNLALINVPEGRTYEQDCGRGAERIEMNSRFTIQHLPSDGGGLPCSLTSKPSSMFFEGQVGMRQQETYKLLPLPGPIADFVKEATPENCDRLRDLRKATISRITAPDRATTTTTTTTVAPDTAIVRAESSGHWLAVLAGAGVLLLLVLLLSLLYYVDKKQGWRNCGDLETDGDGDEDSDGGKEGSQEEDIF